MFESQSDPVLILYYIKCQKSIKIYFKKKDSLYAFDHILFNRISRSERLLLQISVNSWLRFALPTKLTSNKKRTKNRTHRTKTIVAQWCGAPAEELPSVPVLRPENAHKFLVENLRYYLWLKYNQSFLYLAAGYFVGTNWWPRIHNSTWLRYRGTGTYCTDYEPDPTKSVRIRVFFTDQYRCTVEQQ